MNLVIVESPAKCSKIQGYLGEGYKVIATMGHIRALEESLDAIGLERDFDARYEFLSTKAKALKLLKDSAKEATKIYLASDDDREGEAISYSVCAYLKLNPATTSRIVFHEITKKAICDAVASPRTLDMNRVNAQQARSILDMMIGFTMSPLLWKHVAMGLSAGRCQTPALRIIVEREDQIKSFSASSTWRISGTWAVSNSFTIPGTMDDDLEDEESAVNYLEMIQEPPTGTITSNAVRPWTTSAPQPLITSTLQQQASALFSIPPKSAMQAAQRLYEAGHITYMRTDKAVLSDEAKTSIRNYVTETYGAEYVGEMKTEVDEEKDKDKEKDKKKTKKATKKKEEEGPKAQEAHEAIRPTHIEMNELPVGDWSAGDKKIYGLIWQRAIQSQMAAAKGETCTIHYKADEAEDFQWTSSWRRTTFEGWQKVGRVANIDDEDATLEEETAKTTWKRVTEELKPSTKLKWKSLKAEPHESRAPTRFTEATLVRELEKHGIGRPSTFATLITTIQDKKYVETKNITGKAVNNKVYTITEGSAWPPKETIVPKTIGAEKNKLVPTELGRNTLAFMLKHFDDLFAYEFTAKMEQRLDKIADGEEPWKQVLRDMWDSYKERYTTLKNGGGSSTAGAGAPTSEKVHDYGGGLKAVMSKKGPLILQENPDKPKEPTFYGWPEGILFKDITEKQVREFIEKKAATLAPIGEWNGHAIVKKSGKYGPYVIAGEYTTSIAETDTMEQIIEKLEAKSKTAPKTALKTFKEYEIHDGQYGPYIIKPALKTRKFVSVPKGVTIETLTEGEVAVIYKAGLEAKSKSFAYKKNLKK